MASTQDPSMGSMIQPQQSTLNDLQSGSSGFFKGADQGIQTAIGLATAQDDIQQKQAKTEQMKDQLDQMKFNKLTNGIGAITRADPKYRNAIADQVFKGFDRNGIAVDPVWRDALVKDDSTLNQMRQALPILMDRSQDPQARAHAFQTMANYMDPTGAGDGHDKLMEFINGENKNQVTERDTQVRAAGQVEAAQARHQASQQATDIKQERLDQMVHQRGVDAVQKNPQLNTLLTSYQNLDNAKNNFMQGGQTPNEFSELQQAVRANLGIKGSSGVDERAETYLKSLGINASKVTQFLSGKNQNVNDYDPEFVDQVMKLVDLEQVKKRQQAQSQLSQLSKSHTGSFYSKPGRQAYQQDFNNVLGERYQQFGLNADGSTKAAQPAGQGGSAPQAIDPAKVQLAISHGYTPDQIAQKLGVSVDAINSAVAPKGK